MTEQNQGNISLLEPEKARTLRDLTGFPLMECKKAIHLCEGDLAAAKEWLASGGWRGGKLISWDYAALATKSGQLSEELKLSVEECREALMNAGGNLELAKGQLSRHGER